MTALPHRRRDCRIPLRALFPVLLFAQVAGATSYDVTSLDDGVAADGECRLREAIRAAETNLAVHECAAGEPSDTIVLATVGTYHFDQGEEELQSGFLTIRGATASADAHRIDLGGVNRFVQTSGPVSLTLESLTLQNGFGTTGGALYLPAGSNHLRDVTIRSSRAISSGGGATLRTNGDGNVIRIEGCRFLDNLVQSGDNHARGGGLALWLGDQTQLRIVGTTFERNAAVTLGAGASATGGGLFVSCIGSACRFELRRATFVDNESAGETALGAAMAAALAVSAGVVVEDIALTGNATTSALSGSRGSVLDFDLASAGVQALELRRFELLANGGAASADAQVAIQIGGSSTALVESGQVAGGPQSGLRLETAGDAQVLLGQLTIAGNAGAGLRVLDASSTPPRLENSILWGNTSNGAQVDLALETGAIDADRAANHNWVGDQGDADPQFRDAPAGDYSLNDTSGAADAGDSTFASVGPVDLHHAPRVVGVQIDLGALERGGLFADGFESESTQFWSAAIP